MTSKELALKAVNHFHQLDNDVSRDAILSEAEKQFDEGWSMAEVKNYIRTFEEVNPDLEEEVAFARRRSIEIKYVGVNLHLREYDFKALGPLLLG